MKFNSDGTLIGKDPSGDDTGKYTIKDNKFCRQWKLWGNGDLGCFLVEKRTNGYYAKKANSSNGYKFTMK